jgi:hypothetical protein
VRRAGGEILCNFAPEPVRLPIDEGRQLVITTHDENRFAAAGEIVLAQLAAALRS